MRRAPPRILIAYTLADACLACMVADSGPDIPNAESERTFERFVKLDPFSQGLGLGLGACRLIARSLNGEIHLDITCKTGARFLFSIPVK